MGDSLKLSAVLELTSRLSDGMNVDRSFIQNQVYIYLKGAQWIKITRDQFQELRKVIIDNWRDLKTKTALQSPLRAPAEVIEKLRAQSQLTNAVQLQPLTKLEDDSQSFPQLQEPKTQVKRNINKLSEVLSHSIEPSPKRQSVNSIWDQEYDQIAVLNQIKKMRVANQNVQTWEKQIEFRKGRNLHERLEEISFGKHVSQDVQRYSFQKQSECDEKKKLKQELAVANAIQMRYSMDKRKLEDEDKAFQDKVWMESRVQIAAKSLKQEAESVKEKQHRQAMGLLQQIELRRSSPQESPFAVTDVELKPFVQNQADHINRVSKSLQKQSMIDRLFESNQLQHLSLAVKIKQQQNDSRIDQYVRKYAEEQILKLERERLAKQRAQIEFKKDLADQVQRKKAQLEEMKIQNRIFDSKAQILEIGTNRDNRGTTLRILRENQQIASDRLKLMEEKLQARHQQYQVQFNKLII